MTPDLLAFLADWFARQCDGEWEHDQGVTLENLDNPGWSLRIRIEDTDLHGVQAPLVKFDESEDEWLRWRSDGVLFEAYGGPGDLKRVLRAFYEFATTHASVADA